MLGDLFRPRLSEWDFQVFKEFVPPDHFLRKALEVIPWDDFEEVLATKYHPDLGRPPELPVMMLKLEYLRYQYNLSDREVIARSQTDIAFRFFLQVDVRHELVDSSSLCRFRGRLGKEGFSTVFDKVVAAAREHGLVKDRLRIKDATHVLANIAIPTTLALVAQIRDKLLDAAEPFDQDRVVGERINVELLRASTQGQQDAVRLITRVTHLREILAWTDELPSPADAPHNAPWQTLLEQRQVAHKILQDQENPQAGDKTRSAVDPDARRSKHGVWYDGYSLDILMDADSELITQVNVLPANGDEAMDAVTLIRQEEAAHGNDVEAISIDGAGFNGPVLRELEDPDGLALDTYVPPKAEPASNLFVPNDFTEDEARESVTCPAGKTSIYRKRSHRDTATAYQFSREDCQACPLISKCMPSRRTKSAAASIRMTMKTSIAASARRRRPRPIHRFVRNIPKWNAN